jgi:hypothetical protein
MLRLWGWRTPQVLLFAVAQARHTFARARATHDRHIIQREVTNGQWRHPAALSGLSPLAVDEESVYLGTDMGLFALRRSDGHLRWHALPTADLSATAPALAPPGGESHEAAGSATVLPSHGASADARTGHGQDC